MIEFSKLPIQPQAADALLQAIVGDIGTGDWTEDELRRMVDEGCAAALAILTSIDGPMKSTLDKFTDETDKGIVEMIVITMTYKTLAAAIELKMVESLVGLIVGQRPPNG